MRFLDRPKTAGPSLARAPALYQSVPAGVGTSGHNRDLFQERQALSGIAGTTYEPYQRSRHHRTQHLQVGEGGVLRLEPGKPGVGGRPLFYKPTDSWESSKAGDERLGWSTRPSSAPSKGKPNWIARDKQVLSFECYYKEMVEGSQEESERHRRCRLFFHLEDDSLALVEPGQKNSGMVQGRLVRRHSVPFNPVPDQEEGPRHLDTPHINMWDLNVGRELKVYGKMVRPVACDAFTRHFLSCNGVDVGTEEPVPQDSHQETRTKMEARRPLRPYKKLNSNAGQFLENDGKVLRFYGVWEDGLDRRNLVLLYFLADDTIQIAEKHPESGGRYPAPTFLKRTKVPKDPDLLVNIPGSLSEQTLLNVVTTPGTGRRKKHHMLADNRDLTSRLVQYYDAADLKLGMEISICGKKILLHDCDQFTRDYYKVKYGIDGMVAVDVSPPLPRPTVKQVPPYTGLGTEEDSLTSWLGGNSLEPRPPTRDFFKFHALDRKGYDSHVLRFSARLLKENAVDRTRRLVLAFYLSDDSIQVWVIGEPGTGVQNGPFLERGKAKRPKSEQPEDPALPSNYYSAQDLHVGGILDIGGHTILLTEADEYVFDFMEREEQREKFPQSNLRVILDKVGAKLRGELKALMARFMSEDPTDSGTVTEATYRHVLDSVLGPELSEHETTTLLRRYREAGAESLNEERTRLISLVQADLRRDNFSQFDKLLLACRHEDPSETGKLERSVVRRILLSSLGLSRSQARTQAVRHLLDSFLATEEEQVDSWKSKPKARGPVKYREMVEELIKRAI